MTEISQKYQPHNLHGLAFALLVLLGWTLSITVGLFLLRPLSAYPGTALVIFLTTTYFFTGLFITAHDGMHGTITPSWPRINDGVSQICVTLYALFPYRKLLREHRRHHATPGTIEDPDFHPVDNPSFLAWYLHFMRHYLSLYQVIGLALISNILIHWLNIPTLNVLLMWALPAILSSLQLFFFGTYLPHRPDRVTSKCSSSALSSAHRARDLPFPRIISLVTCYHFGHHDLHHARPGVPWWRLGEVWAQDLQGK